MDEQSVLPKAAMKPVPQGTLNVMDNCAVKGVFSGVIGGGMGLLFGLFMGSFDHSVSMSDEYHRASNRGKIRMTLKDMASKSRSYGKNFAAVGLIYSAVECFIEKQRAKHDLYNVAAAGCMTGAVLSSGGGPQACLMGCAAFAAFSTAIDAYMDR